MNAKAIGCAVLCAMTFVGLIRAAQPEAAPIVTVGADAEAGGKDQPKLPDKDKKLTDPPKTDIFAIGPMMGSQFPTGFNPQMMGDFPGSFSSRPTTVTGMQTVTTSVFDPNTGITTTTTTTQPVTLKRNILIPGGSVVAFKVAENLSPRPQDRVFGTYNYYGDVKAPQHGMNDQLNTTQTFVTNLPGGLVSTSTVTTTFPPAPIPKVNIHRELAGFEKTFLGGRASLEVRLPVVQQSSDLPDFATKYVGDLTIIGKYAFILNAETGNVWSGGLGITTPNGPGSRTKDGYIHSTLLQPWTGYIRNFDRFYVQGFHSLVVPTDPHDVTLLFTDIGLNFWLYRAGEDRRVLRFIVPLLEAHVTTPLNHADIMGPLFVPDLVVMTGGVHLGLFRSSTLSLGIATPVTGPRIFGIEAFVQFNRRF